MSAPTGMSLHARITAWRLFVKMPHCKPKRYIVAPDTAPGSVTKPGERVAWATELGEALVERFK